MTGDAKAFRAVELSTARFDLRPLDPVAFARRTLHWTSDREAFAELTWPTRRWTIWRWWRHLRKFARKGRMCHGIWPKGGAAPIGLHVVVHQPSSDSVILGVLVADHGWRGKGAVMEVREAVLQDCFERVGVHRATGWVNSRNFASVYNYQRLGFRREAVVRDGSILLDGSFADLLGFGLLRSEWLARRALASDRREDNP